MLADRGGQARRSFPIFLALSENVGVSPVGGLSEYRHVFPENSWVVATLFSVNFLKQYSNSRIPSNNIALGQEKLEHLQLFNTSDFL